LYTETKSRSLVKTTTWRLIAILNSFLILLAFPTSSALTAALIMNATGFTVFYFFERTWNKIKWGKQEINVQIK